MTKITDEQHQIDNDEISLKKLIQKIQEWVAYLKTQWKLIIGIAALGGIIGFMYASFQKPKYKATISFVLEDGQGSSNSGAMGLASTFGLSIGGGSNNIFSSSNFLAFMKSRFIVEEALLNPVVIEGDTVSIVEYYIKINNLRKSWSKEDQKIHFNYNKERKHLSINENSILYSIYLELTSSKNLIIGQKDKKNSILSLEVESENEYFSKIFCEELITQVSKFYIESKSKKARLNLDILQNQADSVRSVLNYSIDGVAAVNDKIYNLNPSLVIKRTSSTKRQIDVQTNTAILSQLVSQIEMAKVNLRNETPLIQVIDEPKFPLSASAINKNYTTLGFFTIFFFFTSFILIFIKEAKTFRY